MKKKRRKVVLWLLLAVSLGVVLVRQQIIINRIKNEYTKLDERLQGETQRNVDLKDEVTLSKRSDYLERMAREKLRLIKPGETLFIDRNKAK